MIVGVMRISGGDLCLMFWHGWNASQRMLSQTSSSLRICEAFADLPRRTCVAVLRLKRSELEFAASWERERVGAASRCLPAPRRWQAHPVLPRVVQMDANGSEDRLLASSHCPM